MKILALIPARMNSSRFPGKPLKNILGKPMIQRVYENVKKSKLLSKVVIATCDNEILRFCKKIDANVIMTSKKHTRASDRCEEALRKLEKKTKISYDIIVMVQGDEPMINEKMISEALQPVIKNKNVNVTNLWSRIKNQKEFVDPNCIKVLCDKNNNAIYFSRLPIPGEKYMNNLKTGKQVCVIVFRKAYLYKFVKLKESPLEISESIDMLRFIENDIDVKMIRTKHLSFAVDNKKDLRKVSDLLKTKNVN